jgi:hypothetical protein
MQEFVKRGFFMVMKITSRVVMIFLYCIMTCILHARESDERVKQRKIGNFAVTGTMQPGPSLGFGQNIINKCDALALVYPNWLLGPNKNFNEVLPYIVYGMRDDLSILLGFPTAVRFKSDGHRTSGSEDIIVQLEYAFYIRHMETVTNQMTLVASFLFPAGNDCINPPTGFGSPSFFLGVTAEHLATEWYYYTSYGALLTTKNDTNKAGNQFFYQAGFGKNIAYSPNRWILTWMVELNGWYEQKRKLNGIVDQNSGFNIIMIGPSLWFSTERLIIQGGVAPIVAQHLFGMQSRISAFASITIGWRFG